MDNVWDILKKIIFGVLWTALGMWLFKLLFGGKES